MRYGIEDEIPEDIDPLYAEFYIIIRSAQIKQKKSIMNLIVNGNTQDFQRYKWIMERKFPDFNMVQINRKAEAVAKQLEQELEEEKEQQKAKEKAAQPPNRFQDWIDGKYIQLEAEYQASKGREAKYIGDDYGDDFDGR